MYDTVEEANQKLRHTVVLYNKSSCFIQQATGSKGLNLEFSTLRDGVILSKSINDKEFEFRNLGQKLGYANINLGNGSYNEALYLSRMPVRQSHSTQGISQKNLHIPSLRGSQKLSLSPYILSFQQVYTTTPFHDMMEDIFPGLDVIEKEMAKKNYVLSRAFDRQFCVRRDDVGPLYLQYRGRDIGHSDHFYRWKLASQFSYLNETLEHIHIKVA